MKWSKLSLLILMVVLWTVVPVLHAKVVYADVLISRSARLGSSSPSANTFHEFTFTIPSSGTIGSIEFEYCSNSPFIDDPCTAPAGLDISSTTLANQTGLTGFSIHGSTTANKLVLTRPPAPNLAFQAALYRFNNAINNSDNNSIYVRISTYVTDDASGAFTDGGSVVYSTTSGVAVEGFVPPYLTFCTGLEVAIDCSNTSGSFISLGELSKQSANFGTSQYSGATNDPGGFSTTLTGTTMTSGTRLISPLSNPSPSRPGVSQFGVNLRSNSSPNVGKNKSGTGINSSVVTSEYNTPNRFKFEPNQIISLSTLPTDFTRFTVSYVINVSPDQPAGIYSATLTYIAVASF